MRSNRRMTFAAAIVGLAAGVSGGAAAAPAPAATPAASPTASAPAASHAKRTGKLRVALVEVASGASAAEAPSERPEEETFASHFLSEMSDRAVFQMSDARLSGAKVAVLAAEPNGEAARAFRATYPCDAYLSVSLTDCQAKASGMMMRDTDPVTGLRADRWVGSVHTECTATLRLVDADDGHLMTSVAATGLATFQTKANEDIADPDREAVRDTAQRAAKKLSKAKLK